MSQRLYLIRKVTQLISFILRSIKFIDLDSVYEDQKESTLSTWHHTKLFGPVNEFLLSSKEGNAYNFVMNENTEQNFSWRIVKAIVLALGFLTSIKVFYKAKIISLIDIGLFAPIIDKALMLFVLALGISLVFKPAKRSYYLILFFTNAACWVLHYSSSAAFQLHAGLLCLYVFFLDSEGEKIRQHSASLFLSAVFFSAAIFKVNADYFTGIEFLPGGDFFYYVYRYFSFGPWLQKNNLIPFFPYLSIATEFFLAALMLIRPKIGIHFVILFILFLTFIHPPVIFVYLCFLPFVFLFDKSLSKKAERLQQSFLLLTPFFWFFCIIVIRPSYRIVNNKMYSWELVIIVITLLLFHVYCLLKTDWKASSDSVLKAIRTAPIIVIMPMLVFATVALRVQGAPSPLGYSMFSGHDYEERLYNIEIKQQDLCGSLKNIFDITLVGDARVKYHEASCIMSFPSQSGIDTIKKTLCYLQPELTWKYSRRGSTTWEYEDCQLQEIK